MTPIEAAFAGGLFLNPLHSGFIYVDWLEDHNLEDYAAFVRSKSDDEFWVCHELEVGSYRVDFVLAAKCPETGAPVFVAVECDGHEWHERTKEQAARDKARDRFLAGEGLTVLRFTGSEIFEKPTSCAMQAISVLYSRVWSVSDAVHLGGAANV